MIITDEKIQKCKNITSMLENTRKQIQQANYVVDEDMEDEILQPMFQCIKEKMIKDGYKLTGMCESSVKADDYLIILENMNKKMNDIAYDISSKTYSCEEMNDQMTAYEKYQELLYRLLKRDYYILDKGYFVGYLDLDDLLLIGSTAAK